MVEDALRHREGTIPDVERKEQFALGVHRGPDPLWGPRQALDGLILADFTIFDGTEQSIEFIQLHLRTRRSCRKWWEKARSCRRPRMPLQDCIGIDLEHPGRGPDAQAFGQAADDPYDELWR